MPDPIETLEIEGTLVRRVRREVINEYALADLMPHIETRSSVLIPMLPQNRVASIFLDETNHPLTTLRIAMTLPPRVRLLPFHPNAVVENIPPNLALPWSIFVFTLTTRVPNPIGESWSIGDSKLYFSRDPLTGNGDNLIKALLPNIYDNSGICWGDTGAPVNQRLDERLDQLVNEFYLSEFTHVGDMHRPWPYYRSTYKKWAAETRERGIAAYRDWTDWTDPRREHFTLAEAMNMPGNRNTPLMVAGAIPPMIVNPSFGAVEQWLQELQPRERLRLSVGLQNRLADDPNFLTIPANAIDPIEDDDDEDDEDDD